MLCAVGAAASATRLAVVDAPDAAFYATFQNVEPCGKPVLLALDVSGSMDGSIIAGSCQRGHGAGHGGN